MIVIPTVGPGSPESATHTPGMPEKMLRESSLNVASVWSEKWLAISRPSNLSIASIRDIKLSFGRESIH